MNNPFVHRHEHVVVRHINPTHHMEISYDNERREARKIYLSINDPDQRNFPYSRHFFMSELEGFVATLTEFVAALKAHEKD